MAVCVHCGVSKGKRACPALGGDICAPCCGKFRLVEIACPADCRWLGGLAALRTAAATRYSVADHESAFVRLVEHTEVARELGISRAGFCSMLGLTSEPSAGELRRMTEQMSDVTAAAVTAHLAFGHRAPDGTRAVDRLLVAHGRDLTAGQVAALVALQQARGSLYQVQAAQPGVGVVLRDRLDGAILTVANPSVTDEVERGLSVYLWLVENAGEWQMAGPTLTVPAAHVAEVEAALRAVVAEAGEAARAALSAASPLVLGVLRAHAGTGAPMPAPSA